MPVLDKGPRAPHLAIMAALFAGALLIRLAAIQFWRFDGLYGQDAFAYLGQAEAIARDLPACALPPRAFFWPNGYPLLAAMAMGLSGRTESAAQLVNVLCGAALAPLAYALSRSLFREIGVRAGLIAGLIVAVAGQSVLSSIVIMADIPALFWAALAVWLLLQALPATEQLSPEAGSMQRTGLLFLAGLVLGLAVVSRWIYALMVIPFAVYTLYQVRQRRVRWPALLLPVLGGLIVLLPQVWLSLNRPESLLHSWLLNWHIGNAWGRRFSHIDGEYTYTLPVALYYLQPLAHPNYLFPPLGLMAVSGLWFLWRDRAWGALILTGGWLAVVYLFLAGIPYENFRFGLTLYLPAVLLAAAGVESLRMTPPLLVQRRLDTQSARRQWERGLYAVVAVCLLATGMWAVRSTGRFLTAQNRTKTIAHEVAARLPAHATVLAFGLTSTLDHYTTLDVVELYDLEEGSLEAATASAAPVYLLLDLENVARQWPGRPPQVNYEWLRAHRVLTPIAELPPYSLFRVSGKDEPPNGQEPED